MTLRTTYLRVEWDDLGHAPEPDWAYHLRMGEVDALSTAVTRSEVTAEADQTGGNEAPDV